MKIPSNLTEEEVISTINAVVNQLAYKFKFGYHDIEDMKQQARLFAIQSLPNYDEVRPLKAFLWTHIRNRLFNFKRDKYERPDKPCLDCPIKAYDFDHDTCLKYEDKMECTWYYGWLRRNASKRNLMKPISMDIVDDEEEIRMKSEDSVKNEIIALVDSEIQSDLRHDWLRFCSNTKLPKSRKIKLIESVVKILAKNNITLEDF